MSFEYVMAPKNDKNMIGLQIRGHL
jgi:hypothetical protein